MKNAVNKKLLGKLAIFAIAGTLFVGQAVGTVGQAMSASAAEKKEIVYCDDDITYGDDVFNGLGTQVSSTYSITCDEMVTVDYAVHTSAPAFWKTNDTSMTNYCGAMAGRNVIIFYDRWLTNLVPDYTPGMVTGTGIYRYYPDMSVAATDAVVQSLYDLMLIEEVGGTTSSNFRNGFNSYVTAKGYSTSYSSFYQSATSVNLSLLTTAVNQNKVGVVMCSEYNFVYGIDPCTGEDRVQVSRVNGTTAHMMMVFGYKTVAFYNDGALVCTKTFLYVSSGFGQGPQGYMELNDFSIINEAVIIGIA